MIYLLNFYIPICICENIVKMCEYDMSGNEKILHLLIFLDNVAFAQLSISIL